MSLPPTEIEIPLAYAEPMDDDTKFLLRGSHGGYTYELILDRDQLEGFEPEPGEMMTVVYVKRDHDPVRICITISGFEFEIAERAEINITQNFDRSLGGFIHDGSSIAFDKVSRRGRARRS